MASHRSQTDPDRSQSHPQGRVPSPTWSVITPTTPNTPSQPNISSNAPENSSIRSQRSRSPIDDTDILYIRTSLRHLPRIFRDLSFHAFYNFARVRINLRNIEKLSVADEATYTTNTPIEFVRVVESDRYPLDDRNTCEEMGLPYPGDRHRQEIHPSGPSAREAKTCQNQRDRRGEFLLYPHRWIAQCQWRKDPYLLRLQGAGRLAHHTGTDSNGVDGAAEIMVCDKCRGLARNRLMGARATIQTPAPPGVQSRGASWLHWSRQALTDVCRKCHLKCVRKYPEGHDECCHSETHRTYWRLWVCEECDRLRLADLISRVREVHNNAKKHKVVRDAQGREQRVLRRDLIRPNQEPRCLCGTEKLMREMPRVNVRPKDRTKRCGLCLEFVVKNQCGPRRSTRKRKRDDDDDDDSSKGDGGNADDHDDTHYYSSSDQGSQDSEGRRRPQRLPQRQSSVGILRNPDNYGSVNQEGVRQLIEAAEGARSNGENRPPMNTDEQIAAEQRNLRARARALGLPADEDGHRIERAEEEIRRAGDDLPPPIPSPTQRTSRVTGQPPAPVDPSGVENPPAARDPSAPRRPPRDQGDSPTGRDEPLTEGEADEELARINRNYIEDQAKKEEAEYAQASGERDDFMEDPDEAPDEGSDEQEEEEIEET